MKYVIGSLFFIGLCSGCAKTQPHPSNFVCATPFGNVAFTSADEGVSLSTNYVTLDKGDRYFTFSRTYCMEVRQK